MDRSTAVCLNVLAEQACRLTMSVAELATATLEGEEQSSIVKSAMEAVVTIDLEILEYIYNKHPDLRPADVEALRFSCKLGQSMPVACEVQPVEGQRAGDLPPQAV